MPTPFVADAADEAVRSNSILNERKATDIIEETALEVDIRAWRAEGLRLLQAASAREEHVPNGARRPCSVLGDASAQAAIEDAVTRMSRTEGVPQRPPRALGSTLEDGRVGAVCREPKVERKSDAAEKPQVCGILKS
jgi:hypothetical protein